METHIKERKCWKCGCKSGYYAQERPRRNQQKLYWRIKKNGKWGWKLAGWVKEANGKPTVYDEQWKKITKPHAGWNVWVNLLMRTLEGEEE